MRRVIAALAVASLGFLIGTIGNAFAQSAYPDRSKNGQELSAALAGSDKYILTITNVMDGGAGLPTCTYIGEGFNVMTWCDGNCYVSNASVGVDGGSLRLAEMLPLTPYEKYPIGLLGTNQGKICAWQSGFQDDAGTTVNMNVFRRY